MKPRSPRSKNPFLSSTREKVRRARAFTIRRLGLESLERRVLFAGLSSVADQPLIEVEESLVNEDATLCGTDASASSENQGKTDDCLADWRDPAADEAMVNDETVNDGKIEHDSENSENAADAELILHRTPTQGPPLAINDPFGSWPEEWWFDASTNLSSPDVPWSSIDVGAENTLPLALPVAPSPFQVTESLPASLQGTATFSAEDSSNGQVGGGENVTDKQTSVDVPAISRLRETDRYFGQQQPRNLTWSLRSEPPSSSTLDLPLLEMDDLGLPGPRSATRLIAGPANAEQSHGSTQSVRLSRSIAISTGGRHAARDLRQLLARSSVIDGERTNLSRSTAVRPDASLEVLWGVARVTSTVPGEVTSFFVSQAASERRGSWQLLQPVVNGGDEGTPTPVPVSLDHSTPAAMFELARIPQSLIEVSESSDRWSLFWAASTFAIVQIVWDRRRSAKETPKAPPEKPHSKTP